MVLGASALLAACSEDELTPTPGNEPNYFAPAANATDAESVLRRNFYEEERVYLLFNEVLHREQIGTDSYGDPIYKEVKVDLDYNMVGDGNNNRFEYEYITDPLEQERAAQFVQEHILDYIQGARPYSLLVTNGITRLEYYNGEWEPDTYNGAYPTVVSCLNCTAISLADVDWEDNEDQVAQEVLCHLVLKAFKNIDESILENFYSFSQEYYYEYKDDCGFDIGYNDEIAWQCGFIKDKYKWSFPNEDDDVQAYIEALFEYTVEEVEDKFADYPAVISKFKLIKAIANDNGYNI